MRKKEIAMVTQNRDTERPPGGSDFKIEPTLTELHRAGVENPEPRLVQNFLLAHPHVARVLPDVVKRVHTGLGAEAELVLEVDQSAGSGAEYLLLVVRQTQYPEWMPDFLRDLTLIARKTMTPPEPRSLITSDFALPS